MGEIAKAKLFAHGGSQAVRLPKAFRFEGSEVRIRKEGDRVILEPLARSDGRDWTEFWERLDELKLELPAPFDKESAGS